jgi:hypothetical protein
MEIVSRRRVDGARRGACRLASETVSLEIDDTIFEVWCGESPSDGGSGPSQSSQCPRRTAAMNDVTGILSAIEQDDPQAVGRLLPLVYDELRRLAAQKLAREASGQTLQPTALVHDAYVRMVGDDEARGWNGLGELHGRGTREEAEAETDFRREIQELPTE